MGLLYDDDIFNQKSLAEYEFLYYEIKLRVLHVNEEQFYILNVNNITHIIKQQQKLSDCMYQEAIEANYSHE